MVDLGVRQRRKQRGHVRPSTAVVDPGASKRKQATPARSSRDWHRSYAIRLRITDTLIIAIAVFAALMLRFGDVNDIPLSTEFISVDYPIVGAVVAIGWMTALAITATRDHKVVGNGSSEYKRVVDATLRTFGVFAIVAFAFKLPIARGFLLVALPLGLCLLIIGRWAWRRWLVRHRARGEFVQRTVLMGERQKLQHVARQIIDDPSIGIQVVGAVTEHGSQTELVPGVPVLAGYHEALHGLDQVDADAIIFSGADSISPQQMRELGWSLEARGIDLIVAPALTDIAGPRIHARPVAGLPLIYVDFPTFEGGRYLSKRAADIIVAALGLALLSPLMLVISLLIRADGGPALFRQQRVGLVGDSFAMLKFRTMVVDAEDQLEGLLDSSEGNGLLFKLKSDPRVTPIGRWLRRYSLDELPQLVNVLRGEMSLVGPRPPLATEVDRYDDQIRRRLLVKPGITGLWQVSGRSDLSWDDSVRLDLYYVENWSMTGDLVILWRTVRVVVTAEGAY